MCFWQFHSMCRSGEFLHDPKTVVQSVLRNWSFTFLVVVYDPLDLFVSFWGVKCVYSAIRRFGATGASIFRPIGAGTHFRGK